MPFIPLYEAVTERLEILDKDGNADESLVPDLPSDQFLSIYRSMQVMRKFDEKALNLQRQGRLGTYGSLRGQEASQAGLSLLVRGDDWIVPSFREHGLLIHLGVPMHLIYAYWKGDERGNVYPPHLRCLPTSVPVGSQLSHATGLGYALILENSPAIAFGFAGDGASSEGDFHEALNLAGVLKSRTLFFIQNNQWAISVPFSRQTAAKSIAQRAHGYGMPGIQVDGNDALAVYVAAAKAIERVRQGDGPYLIEALTFRMEHHTTADDHTRYRDAELVAEWLERDPIKRFRIFLNNRGLWDDAREATLLEEITAEVEAEVEKLESMPAPRPNEIFDSMYKEMPWHLVEQQQQLMKEVSS